MIGAVRKPWFLLIALFFPAGVAAGDAPFLPFPTAVDHVVTMVAKGNPRETTQRTVTHHAGWTRIDEIENDRRTTDYFGHAGSIALSATRGDSGEYVHLSIFRRLDQQEAKYWDSNRFKTGERKILLGETCEVWNVLRDRERRPGSVRMTRLSCITDDGIELWREVTSGYQDYAGQWIQPLTSSTEAIKVERRAVQPSEVHPPAELLEFKSWVNLLDPSPPVAMPFAERADFETVMEAAQDLREQGSLPGRRVGVCHGFTRRACEGTATVRSESRTKRAVCASESRSTRPMSSSA